MLYLLKVDALVALLTGMFVFATSGVVMGALAIWRSTKNYAAKLTRTNDSQLFHTELQRRAV